MRKGVVKYCGRTAGLLEETETGFRFCYTNDYLRREDAKAVSLTLPLKSGGYESPGLFAFFDGLVSEGTLRELQCRKFKLDPDDTFGLLLASASCDVIGCVTVEEVVVT
ncbi:MAG: HipA N-terminal domain-containing protein [Verrucomicrobiales bacterium]|nr:HipA N-terminal domain-containing protein [Verrucomicrobiales bacterium]